MAYVRIRMRRSTKAQWEAANPILAEGELGYEVPDAGVGRGLVNFKMGDNVTPWNELPYAFKGLSMTEDIEQVSELVTSMSDSVVDMQETVEKMNAIVVTLRRVDIQEIEPDEPNLGQVWIKTDAITGGLEFVDFDPNMDLGGEQLTVNVNVTLGQCTGIRFSIADSTTSAISIVSQTPENNIIHPSCVINADTTGSGVLVCEAYLQDYVIYRISKRINVSLSGSYSLNGSKSRLIVYSGQTQDPDLAECTITVNFKDDMWSLRADESPISWEVNSQYLRILDESQSSVTVRAIAPTNGASTFVKCKFRVKGAGALEQTFGVTVVGMTAQQTLTTVTNTTTRITIANSLIDGTDYIGPLSPIYNNSYLAVDRVDETHYDISTHNYAGEYDISFVAYKNSDRTVVTQTINMKVVVMGKIAFNAPNGIPVIEVDQSYNVDLINSFVQGTDYTNVRYYSENTGIAVVESVNSGSGCKITGKGVGSTFVRAVLQKNGVDLNDEAKRAVVSVSVKGNLKFLGEVPTNMIQGQNYVIALDSSLGGDLYTINWSWDHELLDVIVANNRLSAQVTPKVSGSTTRITCIGVDSNSIEIGRCVTDAISLDSAAAAGTFRFVNSNFTIGSGENVSLQLNSSYDYSRGYTVVWEVAKLSTNDPYYVMLGTGATEKDNDHCVVYAVNAGGSSYVNAILVLNGAEITRAQALITVQGTVEFSASEYNGNIGTPEVIVLNNTLISGTWRRFVWTISDTDVAHFATGFDPDNDQSGAASIIYGPNAGTATLTAMPKDSNNNDLLDSAITTTISSIGEVSIDNSNIANDLVVGDEVTVSVTNPMDQAQYDTAEWTFENVSDNQLEFVGTTTGRTTVTIHANANVCGYVVYTIYKNGTYLKSDRARIVVQGNIDIDNPAITTMNINDVKAMTATSTLVVVDNKTYTYNWVSSDPTVFNIVKGAANPLSANITAIKAGSAAIKVTASVVENGESVVKYESDIVTLTVIGTSSISVPSHVETGGEATLRVVGTLETGTYDSISWTLSDNTIATIAVDTSDNTQATITGIRKGDVTVYAAIKDSSGNVIKNISAIVRVNGVIFIYPISNRNVKFFSTLEVSGNNTLIDDTYAGTEWVSSDTNIFTIAENPGNANVATITPVSIGSASVTFRAYKMSGGSRQYVYSSDPININIVGDIRIMYPEDAPEFINVNDSITFNIQNKYVEGEDYTSIVYEAYRPEDAGKFQFTPGTNTVTVKALDNGESLTFVVNLIDGDGAVVDSAIGTIDVQGELKINAPSTGTALVGTNFTTFVTADSTLLSYSYDSEGADNGIIWESSDDSIMEVSKDENDDLRAILIVRGTGSVTITVKAMSSTNTVVASDSITFTITSE